MVVERWRGRLAGGARRREEATMVEVEEVTRVKAIMVRVIMKPATIMAIMAGGTMDMTGITTEVAMGRMREGGRGMGPVVGRVERRRMGRSRKRRLAERRRNVRRGGRGSSKKVRNTFVIVAVSINFFIELIVVTNVSTRSQLALSGRGGSEGSNENLSSTSSSSSSSRRHSSRNSEAELGDRGDHTVPADSLKYFSYR